MIEVKEIDQNDKANQRQQEKHENQFERWIRNGLTTNIQKNQYGFVI